MLHIGGWRRVLVWVACTVYVGQCPCNLLTQVNRFASVLPPRRSETTYATCGTTSQTLKGSCISGCMHKRECTSNTKGEHSLQLPRASNIVPTRGTRSWHSKPLATH